MKVIMNIKDIPLQQRKQAKKRLELLDAATQLMREKPLAEISVGEICQEVDISKGTFFRYFPRKVDLIFYHVRLWTIESVLYANKVAKGSPGLATIEALFEWTAGTVIDHPNLFAELTALRAFEPEEFKKHIHSNKNMVSHAERLLRFPEMEGIDLIPDGTFHRIFESNLNDAVAKGQISKRINIQDAILSLASIFYGIPLMLAGQDDQIDLASAYQKQLQILWTGLKHAD
jgi:AcrR family transcriptional regulator